MSAIISFKDEDGNLYNGTIEPNATITITNVDIDEVIRVNASAVPSTGQQPHVESVEFIGPSRAGQPITKR